MAHLQTISHCQWMALFGGFNPATHCPLHLLIRGQKHYVTYTASTSYRDILSLLSYPVTKTRIVQLDFKWGRHREAPKHAKHNILYLCVMPLNRFQVVSLAFYLIFRTARWHQGDKVTCLLIFRAVMWEVGLFWMSPEGRTKPIGEVCGESHFNQK